MLTGQWTLNIAYKSRFSFTLGRYKRNGLKEGHPFRLVSVQYCVICSQWKKKKLRRKHRLPMIKCFGPLHTAPWWESEPPNTIHTSCAHKRKLIIFFNSIQCNFAVSSKTLFCRNLGERRKWKIMTLIYSTVLLDDDGQFSYQQTQT